MSKLRAFFKENIKAVGEVEFIVSERFIDEETGKPIPFKLIAISARKDSGLRDNCYKMNKFNQPEFDTEKYMRNFAAASIVEPDLKNQELQDNYGVKSAEDLISIMLTAGEFNKLSAKLQELSGFSTPQKKVEEAKN